jgi:hypothetical protein
MAMPELKVRKASPSAVIHENPAIAAAAADEDGASVLAVPATDAAVRNSLNPAA